LSKEEIDEMQKAAETHAAEDTKRREEVEARNAADTLAYTAEKTLRDHKDKIPAELNQEVEGKISAARSALQGSDVEAIKTASQELNEIMQKVGAAVYQQQPPPPGGETPPEQEGGGEGGEEGEGTVEGEFREV
jgi:molecular chaperone DnaK